MVSLTGSSSQEIPENCHLTRNPLAIPDSCLPAGLREFAPVRTRSHRSETADREPSSAVNRPPPLKAHRATRKGGPFCFHRAEFTRGPGPRTERTRGTVTTTRAGSAKPGPPPARRLPRCRPVWRNPRPALRLSFRLPLVVAVEAAEVGDVVGHLRHRGLGPRNLLQTHLAGDALVVRNGRMDVVRHDRLPTHGPGVLHGQNTPPGPGRHPAMRSLATRSENTSGRAFE